MTKELERAGIATAHVCTMVNISQGIGGNRIVPSNSVLYPTGDPDLGSEDEIALRRKIVDCAMNAIRTDIEEAHIFERD